MANFVGGSAPAMASQILEGYFLPHKNSLKGFTPGELATLKAELEKLQREVRASVPPQDDAPANQDRNRRIGRLSSALQVLTHQMSSRR